ncbi:MAG: alpha-ketoacid dehydrogenase subunit beta [Chloroflexota bacterium]|nr:MAG: alpha-ketoacid dehydrogenase subunit beta [Chloroflexota bacterium]
MTTVLDSLNSALHRALADDQRVVILGEDLLDPYGGAFRVSRGLSSAYPDRVITTPISEAGIVGVAAGMALRGLLPVVEIMFGDFIALAADQLINHVAKFRWMYNNQVTVPLVVRTPMGGRRGYGPTHSQSLEKLFLGVPGLRVLAPCTLGDPGELLYNAILHDPDPVLFFENKLLYNQPVRASGAQDEFDVSPAGLQADSNTPAYRLTLQGTPPPTLTMVAFGYMADLARQALHRLAYENEIFAELIVPTQLAPFALDPVIDSLGRTGRLLVAEEGSLTLGWGAEVIARAAESLGPGLKSVRRVAALDLPIPASGPLEAAVLPGVDDMIASAVSMNPSQPS